MIYYLGQSVECTYSVSSPGIITGFTPSGVPLLVRKSIDGGIKKDESVSQYHLSPLREKDKHSPSGYKIYYGPFCRMVSPAGPVDIKVPSTAELEKEFEAIQKLLNEE